MWTIRRGHRHIDPETLSEYLDGRIGGAALARVDRQLALCASCRDEMESLRSTVALLKQTPVQGPLRSFVMASPPPEPVRVRPWAPLRLPQWAYAGAASAAAIVLAVLVSADASGLLSQGVPAVLTEQAASVPEPPSDALAMAADAGEKGERTAAFAPEATEAAAPETTTLLAAGAEGPSPGPETQAGPPEKQENLPAAAPVYSELPEAQEEGTGTVWRVLEGVAALLAALFIAGLVMKKRVARRAGRL